MEIKNNQRKKTPLWINILLVLGIIILLIGGALILFRLFAIKEDKAIRHKTSEIVDDLVDTDSNDDSGESKKKPDPLKAVDVSENDNIVAKLQEAFNNQDVVGYLYFPDIELEYPIVQGATNDTYLHRNVYGKYSFNGSIYLDYENKSDFTDVTSVVYGHHMNDGSMFGKLEKSLNNIGWEGRVFYIYTREYKLKYEIVGTTTMSPSDRNFWVGKETLGHEEFTRELEKRVSNFKNIGAEKYTTLITCHYINGGTNRYGCIGGLVEATKYKIK